MSGEILLSAVGVTKKYGKIRAVNGISFDAGNEVFCVVGPNGAGKTTLLRIIAGVLEPDEGYVEFLGYRQPWSLSVRRLISYLPEDAGVYRNLTGLEYLEFVSNFYLEGSSAKEAIKKAISISGLGERVLDRIGGYSKGMKRRLLLAGALMTGPRLLILDEPTAGLDVVHATAMRKIIVDYVRSSSALALVSSHNMLEVAYMCDRVALVNRGVIVEIGAPGELLERHGLSNLEEVFVKLTGGGS